ncbi:hypothetical protein Tco_0289471 [Tanacetum coccineum]
MSPPQPSKAGFPANTVQIEDFHVEGLMVGCGRDDEKPDFRTINHNEVYTLEFNDFVEYSCAFNWKNKHIKFPVYNKTVAKLCDGVQFCGSFLLPTQDDKKEKKEQLT